MYVLTTDSHPERLRPVSHRILKPCPIKDYHASDCPLPHRQQQAPSLCTLRAPTGRRPRVNAPPPHLMYSPSSTPSGKGRSTVLRYLRAGKFDAACTLTVHAPGHPASKAAVPSPWRGGAVAGSGGQRRVNR